MSFITRNEFPGNKLISGNTLLKQTDLFTDKTDSFFLSDQIPYSMRRQIHIPILSAGVALSGLSLIVQASQKPLTASKVASLQSSSVFIFDRNATHRYSAFAQRASDGMALVSLGLPLLYLSAEKSRKEFGSILLMQVETGLLTYGMVSLTKTITNRPRPYVYNPDVPLDVKLNRNSKQSFYSGHVAMTAAMSFFTASTFSHYYPDSRWKPLVWSYAVVWPAVTGYCRYAAGKHFPSDILVGYAMGAFTGWIVPQIHQRYLHRKKG
ncbi:phosphatase PAP2 family protein [Xanthocytophaga flava]|uniref:phosphatase PAP2 family protein n=1 Tax=Xanthocytophaga flava TaxID=3048013 RepID=UPI0028D41367|nr:phosphatase PAP2 family protein [Xanthocytophaga flavus]MDJ1470310.1 phosphatase PAP2 family protein [Xanthocytophaga flavus]